MTLTLPEITAALDINRRGHSVRPAQWFDGNEWHSSPKPTGYRLGTYQGKAGKSRKYIYTGEVVAYKA